MEAEAGDVAKVEAVESVMDGLSFTTGVLVFLGDGLGRKGVTGKLQMVLSSAEATGVCDRGSRASQVWRLLVLVNIGSVTPSNSVELLLVVDTLVDTRLIMSLETSVRLLEELSADSYEVKSVNSKSVAFVTPGMLAGASLFITVITSFISSTTGTVDVCSNLAADSVVSWKGVGEVFKIGSTSTSVRASNELELISTGNSSDSLLEDCAKLLLLLLLLSREGRRWLGIKIVHFVSKSGMAVSGMLEDWAAACCNK